MEQPFLYYIIYVNKSRGDISRFPFTVNICRILNSKLEPQNMLISLKLQSLLLSDVFFLKLPEKIITFHLAQSIPRCVFAEGLKGHTIKKVNHQIRELLLPFITPKHVEQTFQTMYEDIIDNVEPVAATWRNTVCLVHR